jgi:hypothetical protein
MSEVCSKTDDMQRRGASGNVTFLHGAETEPSIALVRCANLHGGRLQGRQNYGILTGLLSMGDCRVLKIHSVH